MANIKKDYYSSDFKNKQIFYYSGLPEKQQRHFLGMEYERLGNRSRTYISEIFKCSRNRIISACEELRSLREANELPDYGRQRKPGGGVKKKEIALPNIPVLVVCYVEQHTAGSPTDPDVKWTYLQAWTIAGYLKTEHGLQVSCQCIRRVLKDAGYVKRKPLKEVLTGKSPYREAQFLVIATFYRIFSQLKTTPMLSIDTKKKELLGNLTRNKAIFCKKGKPVKTFDHDFKNLAKEKAVPHGIYDMRLNKGYITLGNSHETADFVVDNLEYWWMNYGIYLYPNANNILIFCDGGGANGHRHYRFKQALQAFAKRINLKITIVHYPPYCSKYNPIERRLFSQIHRTMSPTILTDLEQMKTIVEQTTTSTGLTVQVRIVRKEYQTALPSHPDLIIKNKIIHSTILPQFSYIILP